MSNAKIIFDKAEFFRAISVTDALNAVNGNPLSPSLRSIVDDPFIKQLLRNREFSEDSFYLPWRKSDAPHHEINLTNLQDKPAGFGPVIAAIDVKGHCMLFDEYVVVENPEYCIVRAFKYYDQYYTLEEFAQRALWKN